MWLPANPSIGGVAQRQHGNTGSNPATEPGWVAEKTFRIFAAHTVVKQQINKT